MTKNKRIYDIVDRLFAGYAVAKDKHPHFADGEEQALKIIEAEFEEFRNAVMYEMRHRQEQEAFDIMITCLRYILREYDVDETLHIEHWSADEADPVLEYYTKNLNSK